MSHSASLAGLFVPFEYVTFVGFVFPIIKKKLFLEHSWVLDVWNKGFHILRIWSPMNLKTTCS